MDDQELENFKGEKSLSIILCKSVAVMALLRMEQCKRYSHLLPCRQRQGFLSTE